MWENRCHGRTVALTKLKPLVDGLRPNAVVIAATLGSFGTGLLVERWARLHADFPTLCVVLGLTFARSDRAGGVRARLARIVLLPLLGLVATEVGHLMISHQALGDTLFVLAVSVGVWTRRFDGWARQVGSLISLPFVALLVGGPVAVAVSVPHGGSAPVGWSVVAALVAIVWVTGLSLLAEAAGFAAPPLPAHGRRPAAGARPAPGPGAPPEQIPGGTAGTARPARRLPASDRMAVQLAVAMGTAFAVGRWVYPDHSVWLVLTAYIVCSGNRGRGDVVHKSVRRIVGALAGTVVATLLAGTLPAGDNRAVLALFVTLAVALVLRPLNYAFWAAGVTAMLAFLHGYFGASGTAELRDRLGGILLGAVIAVAASWLILPVRTTDVFRRRLADVLRPLTGFLGAVRDDPASLPSHRDAVAAAAAEAELIGPTLRAHRRTARHADRIRRATPPAYPADLLDAVHRLTPALSTLSGADTAELGTPAVRRGSGVAQRLAGGIRLSIARQGVPAPLPDPLPPARTPAEQALREITDALTVIARSYPPTTRSAPEQSRRETVGTLGS
jgi:Fusaric acid resistance protein family